MATDDPVEQAELESALSSNYRVLVPNNAAELLALVEGLVPEAVLLAANFAGPNGGRVLCQHIKAMAKTRNVPIILICSRRERFSLTRSAFGKPDEILLRPIHIPELQIRLGTIERLRLYVLQMAEGSNVDPLTATYTRGYLLERLTYEIKRASHFGRSLALALLDLDGFSKLNEENGTVAGDVVLREVARVLSSQVRGVDLLARTGEDEFCVVFPETSLLVARPIGERLCTAVRSLVCITPDSTTVKVSASVGLGGLPYPDIKELPDLLRCVRVALARARDDGGDRAVLF
ncbi:MAG: diguanylate cyclase [Pseudomonadota bacterium]